MPLPFRSAPRLLAIAAAALVAVLPLRAQAQDAVAAPPAAEIDSLVSAIENPEARARLLQQLRILRAAAGDGTAEEPARQTGDRLSRHFARIADAFAAGAAQLLDAARPVEWVRERVENPGTRRILLDFLWKLALVLAVGALAEAGIRRLLAAPRASAESQETENAWTRLPFLLVRTLLDLVPVLVFAVAAHLVLSLLDPRPATRIVAASAIGAVTVARLLVAVARAVLAPRIPGLRVVGFDDESANYLMVWARRFANLGSYGYFLADAALRLGLPEGAHDALAGVLGFVFVLLGMIFALQNRRPVAAWIAGDDGTGGVGLLRRRVADVWHALAVIYLGAVYAVWLLGIEGGFPYLLRATVVSAAVVVAARLVAVGIRRLADHAFGLRPDLIEEMPGLAARANRYFAILHRAVAGIVSVVAALAILETWGLDAYGWIAAEFGRRVLGAAFSIAVVVVLAVLFWEMASMAIERRMAGDGDEAPGQRERTLLPLLRKTLLVATAVVSGLVVLSEIGVDIGPLLAGAGVVGLAVGFGSQALVKDVVTGFFILAEDQFRVGDVIAAAGTSGVVEAITIRTIRLRDLSGNVHVLPFSSVSDITNMTKEYSRYVFDVGVAYRENTDDVVEALEAIGAELQADESFGPLIREPLEILGVDELADSAVIVRARIMTDPGSQWSVGREFNRRMKLRFDELGIEMPFPHRTVYFGEDKKGAAPAAPVRLEDARGDA